MTNPSSTNQESTGKKTVAMSPNKKNSGLASLIAKSRTGEEKIIGAHDLANVKTIESESESISLVIPEILEKQAEGSSEEKENKAEIIPVSIPTSIPTPAQGIGAFIKERKTATEVVMAVVSRSQRDELKIVATALGLNLQDLIANIFDNFLDVNQVEIRKAKKKMIEGR